MRDFQRSAVYAWERAAARRFGFEMYAEIMSLDEIEAFMKRVWPKERGRYGLARHRRPDLRRVHWGQRKALSHSGAISLPKWARNPWVILHEMAHELTKGDAHGPRFVGVLVGLASRWMGLDPDELLMHAEEHGVKVYRASVGAVPHRRLADKVARALPGNAVEIAVYLNLNQGLDLSYRQIRGAALKLIREGRARWRGRSLVAA